MGIEDRKTKFRGKPRPNQENGKSNHSGRYFKTPNSTFSKNIVDKKPRLLAEPTPDASIETVEPASGEKKWNVVISGLSDANRTHGAIKSLTDGQKITPNNTEINEQVVITYSLKKHALKACHVLCGLEHKGDQLHAALQGDEDSKLHRRTRLIIRNLPWSCDEDKLNKVFHAFGTVTEVKIPKKEDGRMRGFGFVQFTHGHESAKAIKGVSEINGRKVAIDWCLPREVHQMEKANLEVETAKTEDNEEDEESVMDTDEVMETDDQHIQAEDSDSADDKEDEDDGGSSSDEDDDTSLETSFIKKQMESKSTPYDKPFVKPETGLDVLEGRSVFLRNIPFDATDDDINQGMAFVEFDKKSEADQCVVNTKELSINGRPVFARTSLPQTQINTMKKNAVEERHAKKDHRNLALGREGEIREGSSAWKGLSELDRNRREKMAKEKYEKLKVLENFIDSSKLVVHNIPKNFGEENLKTLCRKAANGDINKDIAKNARKIVTFHLMLDKSKPDDKDKSRGFAFVKFDKDEDALNCLRLLNNHPTAFWGDKRPIVEFAVENSKALKVLADRKERNKKRMDLRKELDGDEPKNKKPKLRTWQIAKAERKKNRRKAAREGLQEDNKMITDQDKTIKNQDKTTTEQCDAPKAEVNMETVTKSNVKPDYSGIEVKKGSIGQLKRPKHVGAKIRARDKGKITRERQMEKKAKRKATIKKLSVNIKKEKGQIPNKPKGEKDETFEKLVNNYKTKISAGLKLL